MLVMTADIVKAGLLSQGKILPVILADQKHQGFSSSQMSTSIRNRSSGIGL